MSVPVGLFSDPDCLCASHADAPGTGDKGVGELLQRLHFIKLQRLTVLQLAVALLQRSIADPLHLDLVEI